jgi:hypothetical protein
VGILFALLPALPASFGAEKAPAPAVDAWDETLAGALSLAAEDGLPILLYFPPARPSETPPAVRDPGALRKAARELHLARARSEEVKDLLARFHLNRVPALVLLDRKGGAVDRWETALTQAVWTQVGKAVRRLREAEGEASRASAEAEGRLAGGNYAAALAAAARARARAREGYPELETAAKVEAAVLERSGIEITKALAAEGLVSDRKLAENLREIRERIPHPRVSARIDRELERIRARSIGGKPRTPEEVPPGASRGGS